MATTVTPGQPEDLVYASFPITKTEEHDGTLYVYGKATDGGVDSDEQIVDPDWSAKALEDWFSSGPNVRVQHNPSLMPAGSGVNVEINRDGDGGHYVKAAIDDPTAKLMVSKGHLRAFSVGIAKPLIVRDVSGKARGGIIKGGEFAEISLVDRPANRNCYVELAKAAGPDGHAEFTGKVGGAELLTKVGPHGYSHGWVYEGPAGGQGHVRAIMGLADQAASVSDTAANALRNVGKAVEERDIPTARVHLAVAKQELKTGSVKENLAGVEESLGKVPAGTVPLKPVHGGAPASLRPQHPPGPGYYPDRTSKNTVTVELPEDVSVSFSPADLAKLVKARQVAEDNAAEAEATVKRDMDPDVGGGTDRDKIPDEDFAGRDRSYPIVTPGDVSDAASSIGRAGDGNYSPAQLRENITQIARRKGPQFEAQLPGSWKDDNSAGKGRVADTDDVTKASDEDSDSGGRECTLCHGSGKIREGHVTCPRCHGDGKIATGEPDEHGDNQDKAAAAAGTATVAAADAGKAGKRTCSGCGANHHADFAGKFCPDCGKKLPPASKDDDADLGKAKGTQDSDGDGDGHDLAQADDDSHDDPDDGEDDGDGDSGGGPEDDDAEDAAAGKAAKPSPGDGVTGEHTAPVPAHREPDGTAIEALEHDAHMPTVPDAMADAAKAAALRFKALGVPGHLGQLHDLTCPAYRPADVAKAHPGASLASLDTDAWAEQAFAAATSAPLDKAAAAQMLWQHAVTLKGTDPVVAEEVADAVHKAFMDANPGPGSAPTPMELSPQRFSRPYITAGHAAASPGHDGPNTAKIPAGTISAGDYDRGYLDAGHSADSPANKDDGPPKPAAMPGRTFYRNTSRDNARAAMSAMHDHIAQTFPDLCPMHGTAATAAAAEAPSPNPLPTPAGSRKTAGPGDGGHADDPETRLWLAGQVFKGDMSVAEACEVLGLTAPAALAAPPVIKAAGAAVPDLVKSAVADATSGMRAELAEAVDLIQKQGRLLRKQAKTLEALADAPEPGGPYRGAALRALNLPSVPEGPVSTVTKAAEQSQMTLMQTLADEWRNSADPQTRERAWEALRGQLGINGNPAHPQT